MTNTFSPKLQNKIDLLKAKRTPVALGTIGFDSPLLLAPMSQICSSPFRLLMEDLGAGGTVSELISCYGITYKNQKTVDMLKVDPREKNIGIQLFGEDKDRMAEAAKVAQEFGPKFIDINMGCPVRKVVSKGGGSALLKDLKNLSPYLKAIKNAIDIPLTIKIRTGWDEESINADEVINIAKEEGVEFVAIHGRTREQQYKGLANWEYLEKMAEISPLPIIGNGDLNTSEKIKNRLKETKCQALMLGRGPIRNPFIFLESFDPSGEMVFNGEDYHEVFQRLFNYFIEYNNQNDRRTLIQIRKHLIWFVTGFKDSSDLKDQIFQTPDLLDTMKLASDFFMERAHQSKKINLAETFMTSGHG